MSLNNIEKSSNGKNFAPEKTSIPFIIVIGLFNEGLEALQDFLLDLACEIQPAAILIAPQAHYCEESRLMQFLQGLPNLVTTTVVNGFALEKNKIYIAPAGMDMLIKKGRISLCMPTVAERPAPDMDLLFQSLAGEAKDRGIGIVFSANVTIAATGLNAIKNAGGLAIVREPYATHQNDLLATSPAAPDTKAAFRNNEVSKEIRDFFLRQEQPGKGKKIPEPPQSKNTAAINGYDQNKTKQMESGREAVSSGNDEMELAISRLAAVNNELERKEKLLIALDLRLIANLQKYKSEFDHSMSALFLTKPDGQILESNPAACELFGYTEDELKQIGREGIIDHSSIQFQEKMKERLETGSASGEITGIKKNGQRFPCECSTRVYVELNGEQRTSTMITDISLRKKLQEEDRKNQQLLRLAENISHVGSWNFDLRTSKMVWSDELYRIVGVAPGEFEPTNEIRFSFIHKDDRDTAAGIYQCAIETGGEYFFEKRIVRPDGSIRNILSQGRVEKDENGIPQQLVGIFKDITHEKQLLENLERSEARFKGAFDNSAIGMALVGVDGSWKEVNDSLCKIVGYSREDLMKLTFQDITHPEDLQLDLEYLNELIAGKRQCYQMEKRYFHKSGAIMWVLLVVSMVKDKQGNVLHFISQIEDITEKKKIAFDLQNKEQEYRSLFEQNFAAVFSLDLTGNITSANNAFAIKAEISIEKIKTMHFREFVHPGDMQQAIGIFEMVKTGKSQEIAIRVYNAKGHRIHITVVLLPVIVNHRITGVYAIANDTTVITETQQALEKTINELNKIMAASLDVICTIDEAGRFVQVSAAAKKVFGYTPKELAGSHFIDFVYPEDITATKKAFMEIKAGISKTNFENRHLNKEGKLVPIVWSARYDKSDQLIYCIARDASEMKAAESTNNRLSYALQKSLNEIYIFDAKTFILEYVNEGALQNIGFSFQDMRKKTILDFNPAFDINSFRSFIAPLAEKIKEKIIFETIHQRANGSQYHAEVHLQRNEYNNKPVFLAFIQDITERKRQEAEKDVFFNLVQSLGIMELGEAWINMLERICLYCGFEYAEAWMVNIDQSDLLLHKRWKNNGLPEKSMIEKNNKIKKGEGLTGNAWINNQVSYVNDITNNGEYLSKKFAIANNLNSAAYIPVLFKGQAIALLSFYSGHMELESSHFKTLFDTISQQLGPYVQNKRSEDELARFFNLSPDFLAIAGTDGFFKKINPSFSRILGFSSKEFFENPISHFTHPDDREITDIKRKSLGKGNALLNFENRYLTKNGETRWLSWTSTPLPEEGLVFAVAKDTTEKRKLDEERNRILESISDFFFALDKEFNFTYMNAAAEKLFQLEPHALIGKNIWEEWPSFKEGIFFENVQQSIRSKEPVSFEFHEASADSWFEESFYPSENGLSVFFRSINDRKAAEKALKEAFKEKDTILESIGDAFFAVDKNWTVTYWNKMSEQLLKVNRAHIVGKHLWDVFIEAIPYSFFNNYQKAIDFNEAVHFEEYYEPLHIWLEVSAYPSHGGLSVYFKDISVRKKAEDSIRTSNERYDLVSKATNDAIWDWDLITNQIIRPGKRLENLFGYENCEAHEVDDFWNAHVHSLDWANVVKKRNAIFANPAENYWEDEYRFMSRGGEYAYVYDKGYIIRDEDGKAIRMIGASQDITKEKKQVNEIIRIQQNLDSLINTTTDLIWSINTNFKIIAANKAYSDAISAITGKQVYEGDPVNFPSMETGIEKKWGDYYASALSGETFHREETFYNPFIRDPWHTIVSFSPIFNKDGKISGVACFAKDITELKKAGQKLLELNNSLEIRAEELANSNGELERFAYVASHDLQEPLRMVTSFLQLLEKKYKDQLDETARKYIHFSVDGADRMKQLINDLLQYSRIGTVTLDIVRVDMNEVVTEVLQLFKNEVHTIDAEIIVDHLPVISAGKSAMLQLMQNLLGNALKYRSEEKPVVTISAKEENKEWIFTVKDNGIGIDSKFKDKIFIVFQRLHNKDEFNGTGIGLAICKKIIESYQGKIWVESEFGKGSRFIFAIPKKN